LTYKLFVLEEIESNYEILHKFLSQGNKGLDKNKYLKLMEQLGKEPDLAKMPLDYEDLSYDCQLAFTVYHRLGNRIEANNGFIGKDYTNFPIIAKYSGVEDELMLLDLVISIEVHFIQENQKAVAKIYADSKKKIK